MKTKEQRRAEAEARNAANKAVREEIVRLESEKGENFANAREVRNLFEKIITNQAARVSALEDVDEEMLTTITVDDLKDAYEEELKAIAAREAEITEALKDVEEAKTAELQTAEERAGEIVDLLKEMAEDKGKGKKKKLKDKTPVIRR